MRKLYFYLIFLCTALMASEKVQATHVMGADFEYQCLGKDSFYITIKVYKDCKGVNLSPITLTVTPLSAGCSWSLSNASMTQVSCEDITPVCKKSCSKCDRQNCNAYGYPNGSNASCSFQYGMEKVTYKYLLVFPSSINSKCCKFRASYEQCCRNGAITTCCANENFFSYAEFDRCVKPCNSSPILANDPVAILCVGNCICLNNGARDTADFDSISYGLDKALTAFGTSATYTAPYTWNNPLQYKGFPKQKPNPAQQCSGFVLDSVTGDLCFTPTQQQVADLVVNIYEWRRDSATGKMVKIGTTRRDMQIIIMAGCTNKPPVIKGPFSQIVCAGELVCFTDMEVNDPDLQNGQQKDTVRVRWNYGIPRATFNKKWNGKNEYWTLCWQTADKDAPNNSPKTYFFNVTAYDDACPIPGQISRNFSITVKPSPHAIRTYTDLGCGVFRLQSAPKDNYKTAVTYEWTVPYPGGVKYYVKDTVHKFSSGGMQIVKHRIEANGCATEEIDTIYVPPFPEVHLPNDTFMCKGDSLLLTAYSVNARPPYKFYWNGDTIASDSFIMCRSLVDTTFKIKIIDSTGCISYDSMFIDVLEHPIVNLGPDLRVCDGDSMYFNAGDNGGTLNVSSYLWMDSATSATLDTTQFYYEKFTRTIVVKVTDTASCWTLDTVRATVNPPVSINKNDVAACYGDSVTIAFTGSDSVIVFDVNTGDTLSYVDTFRTIFMASTRLAIHAITNIGGVVCDAWDTVNVTMHFPAAATIKRFPSKDLCPDEGLVTFYPTTIKDINTNAIVSGTITWLTQPDTLVRAAFDTVTGKLDTRILGATYPWGGIPVGKYIHFMVTTTYGCILRDSVEIIINPKPPIKLKIKEFCENMLPFKLNAYGTPNAGPLSPDGETWSGNGVVKVGSDWFFNPDASSGGAGVGQHIITYIWKDNQGYGCSDTDTVSFFVKPVPVISKSNPAPLCNTDGVQNLWTLCNVSPSDCRFFGPGVQSKDSATGLFDPTFVIPLTNIGASPQTVKIVVVNWGNGCPKIDTIPITVNPIPAVSIPPSRTMCFDSATWTMPNNNYPQSWWVIDDDSAKSVSQSFKPMDWGVGNHKLVFYYTDPGTGCKNKDSLVITVQDTPWVSIDPTVPLCANKPVQLSCKMANAGGVVWTSSTGGQFFQSGTAISDSATMTPVYWPNAADIAQGYFQLTLTTTGNGFCNPAVDTMTFYIRPIPIPTLNGIPLAGCSPHQVFFTGNSSQPNCTYLWDFGDPESGTLNSANGDTTSHIFINNTPDTRLYDIKLKVTTEFGCDSEIVVPQYIASYPIPHADFEPKPGKGSVAMPRIRFQNLTTFVTDSAAYFWKFGDPEFGTSTEKNPTYWYSNTDTGTYVVWLKAVSEHGCVDSISKSVIIGPEMTVFIPNAFSPDNAGPRKNNFFWVEADNYKGFELSIYTRWGEQVFISNQRLPGWNGWYKGKPAQEDVYVYQLNIQNLEGKWFHYNGTVTLLR